MEGKPRKLPAWMQAVAKDDVKNSVTESQDKTVKSKKPVNVTDKAVLETYPELLFEGSVVYSHNNEDCSLLCDDIESQIIEGEVLCVGFDMEWPVLYRKGYESKTALIQLCVSEKQCYLFHVSCMSSFPIGLRHLLQSSQVIKIGVNITGDFWKLERDYDVPFRTIPSESIVDLSKMANKKLRCSENWSLDGLTKNILKMKLNKDDNVRCGNWAEFPLTEKQRVYAATDSFACLKLYHMLNDCL